MTLDNNSTSNFELLGFDVKSALMLLGNNEELYTTILQRFYDKYKVEPKNILSMSIVSDKEELQRTAHTIKGLAATIGAKDLQSKAKLTEYAIRENREPMLLTLSKALTDCLAKIEVYLAQTEAADFQQSTPANELEQKYSKEKLLSELAKERFIPDQELKKFETVLINTLDSKSLAQIMDAIQTLDYPSAIQILRRSPN